MGGDATATCSTGPRHVEVTLWGAGITAPKAGETVDVVDANIDNIDSNVGLGIDRSISVK